MKVVWDAEGNREEVEQTAGKLLDPRLRNLPEEFVTEDTGDPDLIHELDDDHIVEAIAEEKFEELENGPAEKPKTALEIISSLSAYPFPPPKEVPLSQWEIDVIRFRVGWCVGNSMVKLVQLGQPVEFEKLYHVWFPQNRIIEYELRDGQAPPDVLRPRKLRNFSLTVDPLCPPATIRNALEVRGFNWPDIREMLQGYK